MKQLAQIRVVSMNHRYVTRQQKDGIVNEVRKQLLGVRITA